jgi:Asp-tRNA(Asn)/Glu-tRNA(Gln) amidotransferase A subunit family amidase
VTSTPGPLTSVTAAVRARRVSAARVVAASIEQLDAASRLNVLAESAFDEASAAAAAIDRGPAPSGRLAGAPTLVKDLEDWRGHPTRQGSLALRDGSPARTHGVVPQRLIDAGAVVVGKSTLPEFAIEGYTANLLTGVTTNPWGEAFSPGGSSGGSAAALAAGAVLVATATDGGGSIRIPASLCGLVGIKPTNGMIGRWPAPDWIDYSTDGPFATAVDDLTLLYELLVGPVAGDPSAPPASLVAAMVRHHDVTPRLVAAERTSPLGPLPDGVRRAFHDAVDAVADLLERPVQWRDADGFFPDGDPDLDWFTVTSAEHVASLGRDWVVERMDEFHVSTQEFLGAGLDVSAAQYLDARRRRYLYVRSLDELLGDDGVLLTPTVASEGWLADGRLSPDSAVHALPAHVYSTAMQNVTGTPALSVPFGRLATGLPFGLQLTAPHFHDRRLLDLAALIEDAYPWPRTAPGFVSLAERLDL